MRVRKKSKPHYLSKIIFLKCQWLIYELLDSPKSFPSFTLPFNLSNIHEVTHFVARKDELKRIEEALQDISRCRVALIHGLGGIGKTQLAIAYVKRHASEYSAILWFNARDEATLKQSIYRAVEWIFRHHPSITYLKRALESRDLDQVVMAVKQWLEEPMNDKWLTVYDNYDIPLSSRHREEPAGDTISLNIDGFNGNGDQPMVSFDLRTYLPETDHGAIIVTTRSSMVKLGRTIQIGKLKNISHSLEILVSASGREGLTKGRRFLVIIQFN